MFLEGKVAIVTGASQGIGRAIAEAFADQGADLTLCARNEKALEEVQAAIEKKGRKALIVKTDVSSQDDVQEAVRKTLDNYGAIDILVNNAGITRDNLMLRMGVDDWDQVIETNLKGSFLFTKSCLKPMIKKKCGRIINITSIVGIIGNAGQANYAASKAGLIGLTKSTARELASRNINVNAIAPGFIETDMTNELGDKEALMKQIPLGRFGSSQDIANMAVFLASDLASYVTGQVFNVDGGMVI